jgi:hypothetical protein
MEKKKVTNVEELREARLQEFEEFKKMAHDDYKCVFFMVGIITLITMQLVMLYKRLHFTDIWLNLAMVSVIPLWPSIVYLSVFEIRTNIWYRRLKSGELDILEHFLNAPTAWGKDAQADQYEAYNAKFDKFWSWHQSHPVTRARKWYRARKKKGAQTCS